MKNVCISLWADKEEEEEAAAAAAEAEEKIAKWVATGNVVATTVPC